MPGVPPFPQPMKPHTALLLCVIALLGFYALGCRPVIPRAIPVDTKPLQASVKEVKKRSMAVDIALEKSVGSNDVAITKAAAASKALDKVITTLDAKQDPTAAIEAWRRAHYALMEQLLITQKELANTKKQKLLQNESITYLEATVDALVAAAIEQAKAIGEMNKALNELPGIKDKLSFWRWYSFYASLATTLIILSWIFRTAITIRMTAMRAALPF